MVNLLFLLSAVGFTLSAVWFNGGERTMAETGRDAGLRRLFHSMKAVRWLCVSGIAGGFILAAVSYQWYGNHCLQGIRLLFVFIWTLFAAHSDWESRRISNRWIIYGITAGLVFLAAELLLYENGRSLLAAQAVESLSARQADRSFLTGPADGELSADRTGLELLPDRLLGAFLGGGLLFLGAMLRKGGFGMGDVKLFFVLGISLGVRSVFFVLLITLLSALAVGAVLIVAGKFSRKDRLPLGPFALLAVVLAVLGGI